MQIYVDQQQLHKQRRAFRTRLYLWFGFLILLCIGVIYVVLYSPIFQVRKFYIMGAEQLSNEATLKILKPIALNNKLKKILGPKNLLAWGGKDIDVNKTALLEANINRDWLRQSITIEIKERNRFAILCGKNMACYWIDEDGVAFEKSPHTEGSLILIVYDNSIEHLTAGVKITEDRFIENYIGVLKGIKELHVPAEKITFDKRLQEIQITTYSGPDLYFSIRFNPTLNLISFESLKEEVGLKGIKYVDLRVENRLYYK